MLRYLLGDPIFFTAIQTYYSTYAFETASTPELISVLETVSGQSLGEFFDQWVYQAGYPEYEYNWHQWPDGDDYQLQFRLEQIQTAAPIFTIPVEIRVVLAAGDSTIRLPVGGPSESYRFVFNSEPLDVLLDPGGWVLHKAMPTATGIAQPQPVPRLTALAYPVPSRGPVHIAFTLPEPADVVIEIFDVAGRRVGVIDRAALPAGRNSIELTRNRGGLALERSGIYFFKLSAGVNVASGRILLIR
jgi:hypothetical protein